MYVSHLTLHDFRSYADVEVPLEAGVSAFVGRNGQGKTNLVEAVDYLSRLQSHRVASDAPLVRVGADQAIVRAAVVRDGRTAVLEIELNPGRANRARVNRSPLPRARDLLGLVRTVVFAPDDLALVKGDPAERRRFLDDLLVLRTPRLAGVRADYERVLRQRNSLLKTARAGARSEGALATLDVWDDHLARTGGEILHERLRLVAALLPYVTRAYAAVAEGVGTARVEVGLDYRSSVPLPSVVEPVSSVVEPVETRSLVVEPVETPSSVVEPVETRSLVVEPVETPSSVVEPVETRSLVVEPVETRSSVVEPVSLVVEPVSSVVEPVETPTAAALTQALLTELDRRRLDEIDRGVSLVGPHRDDLVLSIGTAEQSLPAKGYASHGESWSLALALKLAAYDLLRDDGDDPILILDDVFAELDEDRRQRLAALVAGSEQVLVTAAVDADIPAVLAGIRYVVAGGEVTRVA